MALCAGATGQSGGDGQTDVKAKTMKPPSLRVVDAKPVSVFKAKPTTGRIEAGAAYDARISTHPRRLGPGQSGELSVVLTLRGDTVVLAGTRIDLRFDRGEGPVALGRFRLESARPGALETVYRGQEIYEENIVFRVPISIARGAAHGKYTVKGEVLVEGRNGKTGDPLGTLSKMIEGLVVVGAPIPVSRSRADAQPSTNPLPTTSVEPGGASTTAAAGHGEKPESMKTRGAAARRTQGASDVAPEDDPLGTVDGVPAGLASTWPYLTAMGVLGCLCFVLLRRRRA